ncbi:MAG: hypothetical protein AB7K36_07585 [Chloroflexota bacterium]
MPYTDDIRVARPVAATPAMRACLQLAFRAALIRLGTDLCLILLITGIAAWAGNYLYITAALVLGLGIGTPGVARTAYRLRRSLDAPTIARLFGPVTVSEYRRNGFSSYAAFHHVQLANGERLDLDERMYAALAAAGDRQPDTRAWYWRLLGGRTTVQLPNVVVTYSQMGRLLLEVRTPAGEVLAHHSGYTASDPAA